MKYIIMRAVVQRGRGVPVRRMSGGLRGDSIGVDVEVWLEAVAGRIFSPSSEAAP
ncbi:MAG: hypothetical protein II547_03785 [Treponema sp.]|nr:hypothetical protein [Treponema sp.]